MMYGGSVREATVVDHIRPHRGDRALFLDPANLQSLCTACHNRLKAQQERGAGYTAAAGIDGTPADPAHPWNVGRG